MEYNPPAGTVKTEVLETFAGLAKDIEAYDPELIILFAPDHYNGMFYDMMPSFCVGIRATACGDWNSGTGDLSVPEDVAMQLLLAIRAEGIDAAVSYRLVADHGFTQPMMLLTGSLQKYPVIPIFINAAAPPLPSGERARALGEAVGHFVSKLSRRILIIASGGLSHDPPFPKMDSAPLEVQARLIDGRNPSAEAWKARIERVILTANQLKEGTGPCRPLNEAWDRQLLDSFASGDIGRVAALDEAGIASEAGVGGQEIRTWLAAFSALQTQGKYRTDLHYYRPVPEWNAGMAMMTAQPE